PRAVRAEAAARQQRAAANPRARPELMPRILRALAVVILPALFTAVAIAIVAGAPGPAVTFVDATDQARIRFTHNNGAFGKKYLPETMGSGGLFLDVDGDGWQDVLLINSKSWP